MTVDELPAALIAAVRVTYGVGYADLAGPRRTAGIVTARQATYYALNAASWPLQQIGNALGQRHHSTVLKGIRAITYRAQHDPKLAAQLQRLARAAGQRLPIEMTSEIAQLRAEVARLREEVAALRDEQGIMR